MADETDAQTRPTVLHHESNGGASISSPHSSDGIRDDAAIDPSAFIPALASHRRLVILYGSQSGCAAELASRLALDAFHHRFRWSAIRVSPLDSFDPSLLPSTPLLLILTSTQGQGDPPDNARRFHRLLMRRGLPSSLLSRVHFSVFGLGDSSYPVYNAVARRIYQRMREVGAISVCRRGLGDDQQADGGVEVGWEEWRAELWRQLRRKMEWMAQLRPDDIDTTRWPPSRYLVEMEKQDEDQMEERKRPDRQGDDGERKGKDELRTEERKDDSRQELTELDREDTGRSERYTKDDGPREETKETAHDNVDESRLQTVKEVEGGRWSNDPWSILPLPAISSPSSADAPIALPPILLPPFGSGSDQYIPFPALLTHNTRLTPLSHFQDVRHLRFALPPSVPSSSSSSSASSRSGLSFEPGDVVEIFPRNDPAVVSDFISTTLGLSPQTVVCITQRRGEADEDSESSAETMHLPSQCSLQCLFEVHLDLCGTPKRSFFSLLALHATDEMQREKLAEWCTVEGRADLHAYCERERRTYAEVLTDFWSARPPLSVLVSAIPRLQPRAFSISSSYAQWPNQLDVTAALLQFQTPWKRKRTGLCSRFLQLLPSTQGSREAGEDGADGEADIGPALSCSVYLPIHIRRGAMTLPAEVGWGGRPVVMVGPGTGIAPFRAMCQHKQAVIMQAEAKGQAHSAVATIAASAAESSSPSASSHLHQVGATALPSYSPYLLLYGCRNRSCDYLYGCEWDRFHLGRPQVLTHPVLTAFSRDQEEKVYVQDVMRSEEVSRVLYDWLVRRSGCLLVAGSSGAMPREVRRAVVQILKECGDMTDEEANDFVRKMEREKRYLQDTW